ncbi:HEAT repeat domain-containing protein [Persicimonas caeni]|uniref:HEAT repeat domain-containing protein n=2 Tax=Persicimonas caeni TaxID=2292766 RepID=A0A4Y6PVD0_PERCE|nr:HEAT repeat domain-containing protein [Persicimonas caeni]QDG52268.1 HEAT repeat domain-containing protein [Persicimonas caeni]
MGNRLEDIPTVIRLRRLASERVVTLYEYSFNLWAGLFRAEASVIDSLAEYLPLMTAEEAFERAETSIGTLEADLDVGLLAFHAPNEPEPKWLSLFLQYLEHDDPMVRQCACASIRWVGDVSDPGWPQLWDEVRRMERDDPNAEVREDASKVLHWREGPKAEIIP